MKGLPPGFSYSHIAKMLAEAERMPGLSVSVITASCVKGEKEEIMPEPSI
jgi:hypothetical protein